MAEVRHFNDSQRQLTGHVVVVEIEDLEVLEGSELGWESAVENVVGEVEVAESRERRELRRNGAGELVRGDGEVRKEAKVGEVRGESAGEVEAGEVKRCHVTVSGVAARDARPCAVVRGGVP